MTTRAPLVERLRGALMGREDHVELVGLNCLHASKKRCVFVWCDYLRLERGVIGMVEECEDCAATVVLVGVIKRWREEEYGRRNRGRRPMAREAHRDALEMAAACGR